jgi:hypothetical protein
VEVQVEEHQSQENNETYKERRYEPSDVARRFLRSYRFWFALIV